MSWFKIFGLGLEYFEHFGLRLKLILAPWLRDGHFGLALEVRGKSMVRWLTFDILKFAHFTLVINSYNYNNNQNVNAIIISYIFGHKYW
jgi:hypothetical protein